MSYEKDNFMDTYWFNKLIDLFKVQTNSENEKLMVLYLDKELKKLKLPYHIDAAGNILVTKGKAKTYPCVVSHMDTIHDFVDDFRVCVDIDNKDILFALSGKQRTGVGGDDKCGIFACLNLLTTIPQIKVVFFSREEIGCKGSGAINKKFFADCRYLIQLDRKGNRDFIQTYWGSKTVSPEFSSEIGVIKKKYKYKNCIGTVTDVMKLWKNRVGISCINLSCGYYNPHTAHEHISINDLWHSIKFTEEIVNNMKPKRYAFLPTKPTIVEASYPSLYKNIYNQCVKCKKWKKDALLYPIWNKIDHITDKWCWDCKNKHNKALTNNDKLHNSVLTDGTTILFACHECGIKTDEMKKGDSLKYDNQGRYLYCNKCALLFDTPNKKESPVICEICQEEIPNAHYRTTIQGVLVCGVCACDLRGGDDVLDSETKQNHISKLEQDN